MNLEPSPGASNSHELSMNSQSNDVQTCLKVVQEALLDVKAKDITQMDVSAISNVADAIVIASGQLSFSLVCRCFKRQQR